MLELKNICFSADGKQILNNVNLTIDDRKFIVITGPNGSGKSTLAKIIAGIVTPDSGQIILDGQDITNMNITERAQAGISFAFQQPVRFKGVTVKDLITLASGQELSTAAACQYLAEVGMCAKDYIDREVNSSLSGGELKRIEIATVMARKTKLTLFDEPEAGIDLWSFSMLVETFKTMSRRRHNSVIIISHQERIMQLADNIAVIANGTVKTIGAKDDVFPKLMSELGENCGFRGGNA